jgi:hypothetical protein
MTTPVLDARSLNRATLGRQFLLERTQRSVEDVVGRLVGMQAQNPLDPYYGLWARMGQFDPLTLASMTENREVVRGGFMRGTVHLFGSGDGMAIHPITADVLRRVFGSTQFARDLSGIDMDALLAGAHGLLVERPRTRAELGRELSATWTGYPPGSLGQAATYLVPVVQIPPRGVWGKKGQATWAPIETYLGATYGPAMPVDDLVIRYLAGFGPAAVKDMRVWSGLTGLSEVFERLRPRLRVYRDENGSELFDLTDMELPDPDTPAPPRLLPEYDNVLLGHSDRTRFFTGDAIPKGWVGNVLVDGVFAGSWKREGSVIELDLTPHGQTAEEGVTAEAGRLGDLAWPGQVKEIRVRGFDAR